MPSFGIESMLLAQQQPHFSGLDSELGSFLKDYERFGSRLRWSKADFVDRLKQYVALQLQTPVMHFCWPSDGESPPSWEQTKSWLWTQFGGGTIEQRLDKAANNLEARSSFQKPNESIDVFRRRFDVLVGRVNRLRREWNSAASSAGFTGKRPLITSVQKCDLFRRRLKQSVFKHVHARCTSRSTIDEVVETVKRLEVTEEQYAQSFGGTTPRVQFSAPEATSLNVTTVGMRRDVQALREQMGELKEELESSLSRRPSSPPPTPRSNSVSLSAAAAPTCLFCNGAHDQWDCDRFCVSCGSSSHTYPSCNARSRDLDCGRCHGPHGTNVCPYPSGKYPPWLKKRRLRSSDSQKDSRPGSSTQVCFHFRDKGSCPYPRCRFRHEPRSSRPSARSSGRSDPGSSRRGSRSKSRRRSRSPEPPPVGSRGSNSSSSPRTVELLNQILANQKSSQPSSGGLSEYIRSQREMVRQIMSEQHVGEQEATDALNSITSQ